MWVPIWLWWICVAWAVFLTALVVYFWNKADRSEREAAWWTARWNRLMDYHDELWELLCKPDTPAEVIEEKMRKLPW